MQIFGIFEVKNKLSEICEKVSSGREPVVVTRHGKPLVKIVPYDDPETPLSVWDSVEESQAKYGPIIDEFEIPERRISDNGGDPLE